VSSRTAVDNRTAAQLTNGPLAQKSQTRVQSRGMQLLSARSSGCPSQRAVSAHLTDQFLSRCGCKGLTRAGYFQAEPRDGEWNRLFFWTISSFSFGRCARLEAVALSRPESHTKHTTAWYRFWICPSSSCSRNGAVIQ